MKTDGEAPTQAEGEGARNEFESVKERLEQIADAVSDESLSLDEALDLYEEAVSLGLQVSDLLEVGISPEEGDEALGYKDVPPEPDFGRSDDAVPGAESSAE